MEQPLISIIMSAYNASAFIEEAIGSVLAQTYENWELLIVNDGSTDNTESVVANFSDHRIKYLSQENKGVSAARNLALAQMKGDFFCFLDADDVLTPDSLYARYEVFREDENLAFVDGRVEKRSADMSKVIKSYTPDFKGFVLSELTRLSESCFVGLTWMVRNDKTKEYRMTEGLTHGEDLLFYMQNASQGQYSFTYKCILYYRQSAQTAMKNLDGLLLGYIEIFQAIKKNAWTNKKGLFLLKLRMLRIMFLSYLKNRQFLKAVYASYRITELKI